jgi:hypothetical protein
LQKAIEQGYNPDYEGAGRKSPEQFLKDGELYNEIISRGKQIKALQSLQEETSRHLAKVTNLLNNRETRTIDNELAYYKEARKESYQEGDDSQIALVEDKIKQLEQDKASLAEVSQPPPPPADPEAQSFFQRNGHWWQEASPEANMMRAYTQSRDLELTNQGYAAGDISKTIESELKQQFPHRFPNSRRAEAKPAQAKVTPSRAGATVQRKARQKTKFSDMSPAQQDAARYFSATGVMTVDEYVKQLKELGEL